MGAGICDRLRCWLCHHRSAVVRFVVDNYNSMIASQLVPRAWQTCGNSPAASLQHQNIVYHLYDILKKVYTLKPSTISVLIFCYQFTIPKRLSMFSECSDNVYVGSATTKQSIVQAKLFSIPFNIVICSLDNYCNMSSGPSQQRKTTHAFLYQPWLRRKHGEIRNANGQGSSCNTGSMPTNDKDIYQDNLFLYNIFQGFITSCPL